MIGFKPEYKIWLTVYILANIIATLIMYNTNTLIGDVVTTRLYNVGDLWLASGIVVLSYFLILRPIYQFLSRLKVNPKFDLSTTPQAERIVGYILLGLQIAYLIFNLVEGVNVAGSTQKTQSPLLFFWIFTPVDMMFLVYYAQFRNTKMFKFNLIAYLVSNILRGWAAVYLFVLFFEWCNMVRKGKINYGLIALLGIVMFFMYPYLLYAKLVLRTIGSDTTGMSDGFLTAFIQVMQSRGYVEFLEEGITHLIGRLQYTSILVEILHYKDQVVQLYDQGAILHFWQDGLPQLAYRKLLGIQAPFNLGVVLTDLFFPQQEFVGRWNINPGVAAWFIITPLWSIPYLVYILILCFLSIWCMKQFPLNQGTMDVVWLAWLVFLLPGWINAFIGFIYSILLMIIIVKFARYLAKIKLYSKATLSANESIDT